MTARRRHFAHSKFPDRLPEVSASRSHTLDSLKAVNRLRAVNGLKAVNRLRAVNGLRAVNRLRAVTALAAVVVLTGCFSDDEDARRAISGGAAGIENAEGAVCGMVVRDQPAPRAQVVHRDGTRLFLCGIADLMAHLEAPSPHGTAVEIYVEAMEAHEDPMEIHLGEHEWIRAQDAIFRVGDERPPMIMGRPVMIYRDRSTAERAIQRGPVEILDFEEFRTWWRRAES